MILDWIVLQKRGCVDWNQDICEILGIVGLLPNALLKGRIADLSSMSLTGGKGKEY